MSTYTIGRGPDNHIVIRDGRGYDTVSTSHAELVLDHEGRYYLTDKGSRNGTYVRRSGKWKRVRQEYVDGADRILLGDLETSVADLMRRIPNSSEDRPEARAGAARIYGGQRPAAGKVGVKLDERPKTSRDDLPSGPVEFDPETGEIVKKRD